MNEKINILINEDSPLFAKVLARELRNGGLVFDSIRTERKKELIAALEEREWDIIISDYNLTDFNGMEALEIVREMDENLPFILISGTVGEDVAIGAVKAGANDYVMKNNLIRLVPSIKRELKEAQNRREKAQYYKELQKLNAELEQRARDRTVKLRAANAELKKEIAERIKAEEKRQNTEGFLNTILENLPNMIFVKDPKLDYRFTYINKAGEKLIGYTREELIGKNVTEFLDEEYAKAYHENDVKLVDNGLPYVMQDKPIITKDKKIRYLKTKKLPIFDERGELKYVLGIAEDITEIKKKEYDLRRHEFRFKKLFDLSPVAVAISSAADGKMQDINKAHLDLLGYTREETIGKKAVDLGVWDNPDERRELVETAIETRKTVTREVIIVTKSGERKTVLMSVEFIQFEKEDPAIIFIAVDITAMKKAERQMRKALEDQKELNVMKTKFISMISHEFRTPLTTIMLSVDLLKRYGNVWEESERMKHFDRIQDTILKMTQLMENVLIIGRIDSGNYETHFEEVYLSVFCNDVAENVQFSSNNSHKISTKYDGPNTLVKVDENLLGLILNNILSNAVRYSPKGSLITFDARLKDEKMRFVVSDSGIGAPQNEIHNLYDSFYRASNVGSIPGYGLGLSIAKKCADVYQGEIKIESEENKGLTATVVLPLNPKVNYNYE